MRNLYEQCLKLTQFAAMEFEEIFQFSQERLKQALETELIENGYAVRKQRGFLYAEGTVPVLLVAHLDTVHRTQPETICYSADGTAMMSPQGIGGDDRAGVYMILRLIQSCHCHVLFCEDEETGGHGARAFTKSGIKPDVNYIVELDRTGSNDAVFYQCRNRQFERHINSFGFQTAFGSFSDISILAPHLNLAAVNLSTGYYHAHQPGEYVRLDKVEELIGRVEKIPEIFGEHRLFAVNFLAPGRPMMEMIENQVYLAQGAYAKVIRRSEGILAVCSAMHYALVALHVQIQTAAAYERIGKHGEARTILKQALSDASKDHMVMPFVENFIYLSSLFEGKFPEIDQEFLAKILSLGKAYEENCKKMGKEKSYPEQFKCLTEQELKLTELMAAHMSNKEIAARLYLSEGTVKQYINQIYSKLEITGDTRTKRKQLLEQFYTNN